MIDVLIILAKTVFILLFALSILPLLIYLERKGSAFMQDRAGPNRAHIAGLRIAGFMHVIADVVKLIMKEMMIPPHVNRLAFMIAPFIGFTFIVLGFAVVPWADTLVVAGREITMQVADLNAGILFILAVTSLNVYGMVLAGWSSNNKFALMGGLRATAQMISYEIPLGLSIVGIFMVYQTTQLNTIVLGQGDLLFGFLPKWGVFVQPLGCILFTIAAFAEANRNPFDLPEGESEIVAGYHVEYSGIRFALFYMGEYVAIALASALIATMYFGGWQVPYMSTEKLAANAPTILKIMVTSAAVGASVIAAVMFVYSKRIKGNFGDIRDYEGLVLGVVHVVAALGLFFLLSKVLGISEMSADASRWVALVVQISTFTAKTLFFCWFFIWVRWSLPRFRYDQLMRVGWKNMIPLSFINIFLTALVILLTG